MKKLCLLLLVAVGLIGCKQTPFLPPSHYDRLADQPYIESYLLKADIGALKQELLFERGVQAYLWALPALNMYGMKEGSEKVFGKGYKVLPIFKERLTAKTLITHQSLLRAELEARRHQEGAVDPPVLRDVISAG
jgi:hypothetical protein